MPAIQNEIPENHMSKMLKLGIFVGENNWSFFHEIYKALESQYRLDVFEQHTFNTPLLYGRLNRWVFQRGIKSILNRNDICFFEWASCLMATASHMPKRSKIITRLHSFELYEWAPRINWEAVDKIILVSQTMQRFFSELYPKHAAKTEVVYNGINLNLYKPPLKKDFSFRIGMLCYILPIKRVYEVILMLSELRKRGYDVSLHIAGNTELDLRYKQSVYRLVEELKLSNVVTFYGPVDDSAEWLGRSTSFYPTAIGRVSRLPCWRRWQRLLLPLTFLGWRGRDTASREHLYI
jgi:glycosyltransferase involved in cell wall biosynthesis